MTRRYEIADEHDDDCAVCGEPRFNPYRCEHCHTIDEAVLHDRVKPSLGSWTVRVEVVSDKHGRLAA